MFTQCFEDAYHASEKFTRQSQLGILICCEQSPVMWLSKKQNLVETLTFGSKFTALKIAVKLVIALGCKLCIFGVPLKGPTDMFCDNESVFKNISTPESVLRKKYHRISYYKFIEAVAALICRVARENQDQLGGSV